MTSITDAPVGVKRVVRGRYNGSKNAEGAPHGMGVLLTDVVFYKGEFVSGKFHGQGFLRRFGPPGSANPANSVTSPNASASPKRPLTAGAATIRARPATAGSPVSPRASASTPSQPPPSPNRDLQSPKSAASPKVVSPNGSRCAIWTYIGDFWEGKRHGHGKILFHSTGESYEGDWFHDEIRGRGVYALPSGVYTGAMYGNRRHGIGTMIYVDGSGYRGHWNQDVIHGAGRLVEPDGTYYDGNWNRGVMNGIFHMTKPSGSVYRRQYLDGRKTSDEKRKGRDLYSKLFEPAPPRLSTEDRLAQVFPVKVEPSPADAEAALRPEAVEGITSDVFTSRQSMRRPNTADPVMSLDKNTSLDGSDLTAAIDFEDMDDDGEASPQQTTLTRQRSMVRPLSELREYLPRRPHSAGGRPTSAGGESDDDDHQSPSSHRPLVKATSVLANYGNAFSPNATLVTSDDHTMESPSSLTMTSPTGSTIKLDAMSPHGGELLQRFTSALMQEAEKLGDAPVPDGQDDESKMSHDEWLERFHSKRREAELDRKATLIFARHDTLRRANTLKTPKSMASMSLVSAPGGAMTPFSGPAVPPTSPRADPAFGPVLGSFVSVPNMSFMERTFTSSETSSSPQQGPTQDAAVPLEATLRMPAALQPIETNYDDFDYDGEAPPPVPPSLPSAQAPDHLLQRLAELSQSPPRSEVSVRRERRKSVMFSPTAPANPTTGAAPPVSQPTTETPKFGRRSGSQAALLPAA